MTYSKVGLKEKIIIILIFASIIYLSYMQINKPIKKIEKIEIKEEEKKVKVVEVSLKKQNFKKLFVPAITNVYNRLNEKFLDTKKLIENNPEDEKLISLKKEYNASTNEELLIVLKPHPISIALAQAATESAWGTSRFFKEAYNIFGVWSFNKNEPRIAASIKRDDKTIYLKKFTSIEDAVTQYYKMLSTNKVYQEFKQTNYESEDPIEIAKKLTKYSEQGEEYTKKIIAVLKYNKFNKYDKI